MNKRFWPPFNSAPAPVQSALPAPDPLDPDAWQQEGDDAEPEQDPDVAAFTEMGLDEDVQQQVMQYMQQRDQQYLVGLRQQMRQNGWDLNADGEAVIYDQRQAWELQQQQQHQQAPPPAPPAPPQQQQASAPDEVVIPDAYASPREYQGWVQAQAKAAVEAAMKPLLDQLGGMQHLMVGGLEGEALQRVRPALDQLGYGPLADAPGFQEHFLAAMRSANMSPEHYRNPHALAKLALMTLPDLVAAGWNPQGQQQPSQQRPAPRRDQGERYAEQAPTREQQAFAELSRQGLAMMSPSESAGAPRQRPDRDPTIEAFARGEGISYEEAALAASETINSYEYADGRKKALAKRGNAR